MWERMSKGSGDEANEPDRPEWCPEWAPSQATLNYVSSGLTGVLLVLVAGYLVWHLTHGRNVGQAATIGAGVGVGGAGT